MKTHWIMGLVWFLTLGTDFAPHAQAALSGDVDGNFVVNLADLQSLVPCMVGPASPPTPQCQHADLNADGRVDLADAAELQNGFGCEQGPPEWAAGLFCLPGLNGTVSAATTWDDGTGPALYVGGCFNIAGCASADSIAKWDGSSWSPMGTGFDQFGWVNSLTVFDDGTGPALYAGGDFDTAGGVAARNIAKWDGTSWSPMGTGFDQFGWVNSLTVFDDGTGPALYAGGFFTTAGWVSANNIAKWDPGAPGSWSPLGTGTDHIVDALTVFDDGTGPALYAGGSFTTAGGVSINSIAKWDGSSWSPLGSGMDLDVSALTVFDDGTGPALYAGGRFSTAGGVSANSIAKWDGSCWSPLGTGMGVTFPYVQALTVFDDGTGPALYAGGDFRVAGGVLANRIAKWDGSSWSLLGTGIDGGFPQVLALTVFDDGTGPALYTGGYFFAAGGVPTSNIAKWDGSSWSPLGTGMGMNDPVEVLTVFDDGTGPALYAGGSFTTASGVSANYIAKWDGSSWLPLGTGVDNVVYTLTVFDDGTGPALYVGGEFIIAGGVLAPFIAKWNGSTWSRVGAVINNTVYTLTVFDDGTGPALYAGGDFGTAGEISRIAKWDPGEPGSWSPLGTGLNRTVLTLTVFDDGSGPALYAGGFFTTAGGVSANRIAKWDGMNWSPLGTGMDDWLNALIVFDDGTGPALYAGGGFTTAGGVSANSIAKWDGANWSPLGTGTSGIVIALTAFDDGSGPALYAGGAFATAGGVATSGIAKWDPGAPGSWSPLGTGMNGSVWALTVFDDGTAPALYAGGQFTTAGDNISAYLAKWSRSAPECPDGGPFAACANSTSSCFFEHAGPGCSLDSCCHMICENDPSCCGVDGWNDGCVAAASVLRLANQCLP